MIYIAFFCVWYFLTDAYFGYELGDQIIVFTIVLFTFISLAFLLFKDKMNDFLLTIFIVIAVSFDVLISFLLFKSY